MLLEWFFWKHFCLWNDLSGSASCIFRNDRSGSKAIYYCYGIRIPEGKIIFHCYGTLILEIIFYCYGTPILEAIFYCYETLIPEGKVIFYCYGTFISEAIFYVMEHLF